MTAARRSGSAAAWKVRLGDVALVAAGGAVGTLARVLVEGAVGAPAGFPLGLLLINSVGAYLLGALVAGLAPRGEDRWRSTRLLLGTGLLGGFTTYSALVFGTADMIVNGGVSGEPVVMAALYAFGTLLAGLLAASLGILTGAVMRRSPPSSEGVGT